MFLNKTHIHEHVPGLISWNVGHEGKKGKAQGNLPGGAGYGSKRRVPETATAADTDLRVAFPGAPGYSGKTEELCAKGPAKPPLTLQIAAANRSRFSSSPSQSAGAAV